MDCIRESLGGLRYSLYRSSRRLSLVAQDMLVPSSSTLFSRIPPHDTDHARIWSTCLRATPPHRGLRLLCILLSPRDRSGFVYAVSHNEAYTQSMDRRRRVDDHELFMPRSPRGVEHIADKVGHEKYHTSRLTYAYDMQVYVGGIVVVCARVSCEWLRCRSVRWSLASHHDGRCWYASLFGRSALRAVRDRLSRCLAARIWAQSAEM